MKIALPVIQITKTPILLIAGCIFLIALLVVGFTSSVRAESYEVFARVDAPLPTSPAVITSPTDQQHVTTSPITITGTCGDATYVSLFRNDIFVGAGACDSGSFSIQTDLIEGANQLQARVYNSTDNEGPLGPIITVYYDRPTPASTNPITTLPGFTQPLPNTPSEVPSTPGALIVLAYPYSYRTYKVGETWQGDIAVSGGSPPYAIAVDWGDGELFHFQSTEPTRFKISHVFKKPGTYQPIVRVVDQQGATASLQLLIPVVAREVQAPPPTSSPVASALTLAVGVFVLAGLVVEIGVALGSFLIKKPPIPK